MLCNKVRRAVRPFLRMTTLHGFKYLDYPHNLDRVGWLMCCCASACGAAVLCTVLWSRFRHSPLLLSEVSLLTSANQQENVPLVAICPSPYRAAQFVANSLSTDIKEVKWLPKLFDKILRGKTAIDYNRLRLDELLKTHNRTLSEILLRMSPCDTMMRKCRWQSTIFPCEDLFDEELTRWGTCCIMRPERLMNLSNQLITTTTFRLDMIMDCYINQILDASCSELFIKYAAEDWLGPWFLTSGYSYAAGLVFIYIHDTDRNKLVNGTCVSSPLYSQTHCMIQCLEIECGCSHPLRLREDYETNLLPPCSVMRMKCLGNFLKVRNSCNCLPACQRVSARLTLEENEIKRFFYSYDPINANVNTNSSIVLNLRIRISGSKNFNLLPTDTWLTLLSSLGGVFNMFLGVGLFSFLEFLFLFINVFFRNK